MDLLRGREEKEPVRRRGLIVGGGFRVVRTGFDKNWKIGIVFFFLKGPGTDQRRALERIMEKGGRGEGLTRVRTEV